MFDLISSIILILIGVSLYLLVGGALACAVADWYKLAGIKDSSANIAVILICITWPISVPLLVLRKAIGKLTKLSRFSVTLPWRSILSVWARSFGILANMFING